MFITRFINKIENQYAHIDKEKKEIYKSIFEVFKVLDTFADEDYLL